MSKPIIFEGSGIAILTPFTEDKTKVDFDKFEKLINYQIDNGTDAIIVCGTTGEGSTLSNEEHIEAVKFCVDVVNKRVPVIAGTGSNDTEYGVQLSNECEKVGVDGLLMVTPYYNKTSQRGLIAHYNYIADRVSAPIILYNVPSRTGVNILPETYAALAEHERIVAAKEATGNISQIGKTAALCGDRLTIYSGNDDEIVPILSLGGRGVISVMAHVIPRETHDMVIKYLNGDAEGSRKLQLEYMDLAGAMFCDVNPIPVKEAMKIFGMDMGDCRLPLLEMTDDKKAFLRSVMAKHGLAR